MRINVRKEFMLNVVLSSCFFVSADGLSVGLAVGLTLLAGIIIAIFFVVLFRKRITMYRVVQIQI